MKNTPFHFAIFFLILFAGIFLRAYDWMAIPFTHDEFSALFRTGFTAFDKLIEKGVANDGHPAGIQVFLNYWIALVGDQPYLVKLPFLACGLGSIYLTYRLGAFWFHQTSGITAAAIVAGIQPMVMYSQIARPYMSGVFLVLLAVWSLSQYLTTRYHRWGPYIGWILAAIGAAYNHYFSLLTIAMVGLFALLAVPKAHLKSYILSGLLIFLGFAPHLPLTLGHLQMGGLGWLPPPENTFFFDFLGYITHYSVVIQVIYGLLLVLGLWFHFRYRPPLTKQVTYFRVVMIAALIFPALIGFWYSKAVAPVLQFSSLVFGLPLFLVALTSLLPPFSPKWLMGLVVLLLGMNAYTLIEKRHHYKLLYENRYKATRSTLLDDLRQYDKKALTVWLGLDEKILRRWKQQEPRLRELTIHNLLHADPEHFKDTLSATDKPYMILAFPDNMNWTAVKKAKTLYSYTLKVKNWHLGRYFLLARQPHPDTIQLATKIFRPPTQAGNEIVKVPAGKRYGPFLEEKLKGHLNNPNDVLMASAFVKKKDTAAAPQVALSIHRPGKEKALIWRGGRPLRKTDTGWQQVVGHLSLAGKPWDLQDLTIKAGVWDPKSKGFEVRQFQLEILRGNRWYYGLRSPIPKPF